LDRALIFNYMIKNWWIFALYIVSDIFLMAVALVLIAGVFYGYLGKHFILLFSAIATYSLIFNEPVFKRLENYVNNNRRRAAIGQKFISK